MPEIGSDKFNEFIVPFFRGSCNVCAFCGGFLRRGFLAVLSDVTPFYITEWKSGEWGAGGGLGLFGVLRRKERNIYRVHKDG